MTILFIILFAINSFCCGGNIWSYMKKGENSSLYIGIGNGITAALMFLIVITRG